MKRIQGPDGVVIEFPDDMSDSDIVSVMQRTYGGTKALGPAPAPPPGAIVHGAEGSFLAGQPDVSVARPQGIGTPEDERQNAIAMEALKWRGQGGMGAARPLMPLGQGVGMGWTDEAVSGLSGATAAAQGGSFSDAYDLAQEKQRQELGAERQANPIMSAVGEVGGAVIGALPLATAGAARFLPSTTSGIRGLLARSATGLADGAALGAVSGAGQARAGERGSGALQGAAIGGVAGAAAPAIASTLRAGANALGLTSAASRANERLAYLMQRSGMTPDDVDRAIAAARADSQPEYMVGDAMGRTGREELSRLTRTASDTGDDVFRTLEQRALGAQRRLGGLIEQSSTGRPGYTSAMAESDILAARDAAANIDYGAARAAAGAVDPTQAIQRADDFLNPGGLPMPQARSPLPDDSVEAAVRRARGMLTNDTSMLTDFDAALRAKIELDAMIEKAPKATQARLIPIRNALNDALGAASAPYDAARTGFRQASQRAEAVTTGRDLASRGRFEDTLGVYGAMPADQQAAAKIGYGSKLVEDVRAPAPTGDPTQRLRGIDTQQEVAAILGDKTNRQIAREYDMFRAWNRASGNSATAQNMAEDASAGTGIAGAITDAAGLNVGGLAKRGLGWALAQARGEREPVRKLIADALLSGNTSNLTQQLAKRGASMKTIDAITRALLMGGGSQAANGGGGF
jgi:hypothetical protein